MQTKEKRDILLDQANRAKANFKYGQLDFEEAKEMIEPYINYVNNKSKELDDEFGQKSRFTSVTNFLRQ